MLNKYNIFVVLAFLMGCVSFAPPACAADGALTVTGIVIDKTDKNAVLARDAAIAEAQRVALQIIAQKSMTSDELKSFTMPDDKAIALIVQDFEIKNEQLAADRYKANFTVRFTPDIATYINVPSNVGPVITVVDAAVATTPANGAVPETPTDPNTVTMPAPQPPKAGAIVTAPGPYVIPNGARNVLILPYLKDTTGKRLLWEDPNPWREDWQENGNAQRQPDITFSVPQGDLDDVAAGNTDIVWSGDYTAIEKLRTTYQATEVALVVANQSVTPAVVELYMYHDNKLTRLKPLPGFKMDDAKNMIPRVLDALAAPQADAEAEKGTAAVPTPAEKPAVEDTSTATSGLLKLTVVMNFESFPQWADAQKRLATVTPPLDVNIVGMTRNSARMVLSYNGGGIETFKAALVSKGLALNDPVTEVGESVPGNPTPTQNAVYELTLLSNSAQ
jgi:hypothetical protein